MAIEDDVRSASTTFYAALNQMIKGDAGALADVWSHADTVTTQHPIGGRETGWDNVGPTWDQVAKVSSGGQVALQDQHIQVGGDMAYEVGTEKGELTLGGERVAIDARVTNVYRREGGTWKIVHHHTDISPAMVEALGKL
jgi:ketosteroid isomerase-like protein